MVYTIGTGVTPSSAPIGSGATPCFTHANHHIGSGALPTSSWSPPTSSNTWNPPSSSNHTTASSHHHHNNHHHHHSSVFIESTPTCQNNDHFDPPLEIPPWSTPEQAKEANRGMWWCCGFCCLFILLLIIIFIVFVTCTDVFDGLVEDMRSSQSDGDWW